MASQPSLQPLESTSTTTSKLKTKVPYRQIRALYDDKTITVYQAYNASIADAAVAAQKLNASPLFRSRMTWVKPSWCWVNYRAGYSFKDKNQERILALRMSHAGFLEILRRAELTTHEGASASSESREAAEVEVKKTRGSFGRVQWDPERSPRLEKLEYRSIQIGIPAELVDRWIDEWIVEIEDVTEKARSLKALLEAEKKIQLEELRSKELMPEEREYDVPEDIRKLLKIDIEAL